MHHTDPAPIGRHS